MPHLGYKSHNTSFQNSAIKGDVQRLKFRIIKEAYLCHVVVYSCSLGNAKIICHCCSLLLGISKEFFSLTCTNESFLLYLLKKLVAGTET